MIIIVVGWLGLDILFFKTDGLPTNLLANCSTHSLRIMKEQENTSEISQIQNLSYFPCKIRFQAMQQVRI